MSIPYALRGQELIDPYEFDTGGRKPGIVCPGCKEPLVAKVGEIREPHFAHLPDWGAGCEYRTVLHRVAVRFLARRVGELLRTRTELFVRWKCSTCGQFHRANVLDGILITAMGQRVGPVRPDLSLFASGNLDQPPRAVLHLGGKPADTDKLAFYRANNIRMWLLKRPVETADAEAMRDDAELTAVEVLGIDCPQPKLAVALTPVPQPLFTVPPVADPIYPDGCPSCGKNLKRRHLYVRWRYPEQRTSENAAIVMLGRDGDTFGPTAFTVKELEVAAAHGADVKDRGGTFYEHHADILKHSQPVGSYSQGCPRCGRVVPDQMPQTPKD